MAGNTVSEEISFTVNRFGSEYDFQQLDYNGKYLQEVEDLEFLEYSVDQLDMKAAKIEVIHNGKNKTITQGNLLKISEKRDNGYWLYTYKLSKDAFEDEGTYQIQIFSKSITDGTINSSVSIEYAFILDKTPPEIIISGIEDNAGYEEYEIPVTVDLRDISGIESFRAYLNDTQIEMINEDGLYTYTIPASEERQNFKVEVIDKAGNKASKSISDFIIASNTLEVLVKQDTFNYVLLWGIIIGSVLAIVIVIWLIIRKRKADLKVYEHHEKIVRSNSGSSSGGSSSGSSQ